MSLKMNEKDKNTMLDNVLPENEFYCAKLWGVVMANSIKTEAMIGGVAGVVLGSAIGGGVAGALGALSNQYCYIGLTENRIVFCVIETFDCSKVKVVFDLELSKITNVKSKFTIIPGRKVLVFNYEGGKLKLSLMSKSSFSDLQGQKENVETFINKVCK